MPLKGRSAIVTGSTSSLGQAIADTFAAAGCNAICPGWVAQ
jgi:NAD(P)-dependent dehydrogenase (short-subunit alcohol dehydrogenase family)